MLVCDVALGNSQEYFHFYPSLAGPTEGYQSVHGVKSSASTPSDFVVRLIEKFVCIRIIHL